MELTPWKCWWFGKHLNDNFDFRSQKGQIVEDTVVVVVVVVFYLWASFHPSAGTYTLNLPGRLTPFPTL